MDLGLQGRRALVGGGGSGIGGGIATALAGEGARVALIGRTRERIEGGGGAPRRRSRSSPTSSTPDGPADAVAQAVAALGGLDLLVVNTGGPPGGTFDTLSEADWETAIAGTLQSTLRLLRAALPHLREGHDPSILIVLSSSVREPIPALTTSNVLRPGLAGLVKTLTAEIAPSGSTAWRRAGSPRTGSPAWTASGRRRPGSAARRSRGARRRRSRSAATATSRRSGGSARSCSRPRRRS